MGRKLARFLLWSVLIVGVLVGALRAVAIRWMWVPVDDPVLGASVGPTLGEGDLIILWRLTKPGYGDLVLCPEPDSAGRIVIGRLLGEEGDLIEVRADDVIVNGDRSETEVACDDFMVYDPNTDAEVTQKCIVEVVKGHKHEAGMTAGHKNAPPPVRQELKAGEVFLVSDNRLYPYDSRDFGPVLRETCQEAVIFRLVGGRGWADTKRRLTYIP